MKKIFFIFLMMPLFIFSAYANNATSNSPDKVEAGEILTEWEITKEESALGDSTSVVALKPSVNKVMGMPLEKHAYFVIRCSQGKTESYITTPAYMGLDSPSVAYRLDNEKIVKAVWGSSTGGKAIFIPAPVKFLTSLIGKNKLALRFHPYDSVPVEVVFDISDIQTALEPIQEVCGWEKKK